jgi:hypothetical protein
VLDALAAVERDGVIAVRRVAGRPNRCDLSRVTVALAARAEPVCQADRSMSPPRRDVRGEFEAKLAEPVRDADRSGTQTSAPAGRDQSVWRMGPVRLADPKDPKKQPKKEATAVLALDAGALDAALALPIAERAKLVLGSAREAQRLRPQQWSETRQIAEAYGGAVGRARPLSEIARDSGLRAILVLLAAGYSAADVEWAAANGPAQAWWRGGERVRGLGSLSVEVVLRALARQDVAPRPRSCWCVATDSSEHGARECRRRSLRRRGPARGAKRRTARAAAELQLGWRGVARANLDRGQVGERARGRSV